LNDRFDELFEDDTYLNLKNWLFSYQLRRRHLRPLLPSPVNERVLDLGSGISPIARPDMNVVYVDISFQAMRYLSRQHPEASFVVADVSRLPFANSSVSGVVCSEVLEHVEHDGRTLAEMNRVLRPGGKLLLSLPIHSYYYTFDDSYVGHFRRYALGELLGALQDCGFFGLRVRKVAGLLEKLATYTMVRSFDLLSRRSSGRAALGRGQRWWIWPYKTGNTLWSYVCWLESKITPLGLTTIVSIQCEKASPASRVRVPTSEERVTGRAR
jgi:SAM-dependent methyltransferase